MKSKVNEVNETRSGSPQQSVVQVCTEGTDPQNLCRSGDEISAFLNGLFQAVDEAHEYAEISIKVGDKKAARNWLRMEAELMRLVNTGMSMEAEINKHRSPKDGDSGIA